MKAKHWLFLLLQGLVGIIFGLVLIVWPIKSLVLLTWLAGAFLLLESVFLLIYAFVREKDHSFGVLILQALLGILVSLVILAWPQMTVQVLFFFFALWCLVAGVIGIFKAAGDKDEEPEVKTIAIMGCLLTVGFGILLLTYPEYTVGIIQILFGVVILFRGIGTTIYALKAKV